MYWEFKTVLDAGFHTLDSGFPGTRFQSLSVRLGFWIPVFRRIADSMSCYSRYSLKQTFIGFRNPDSLTAFFLHNLHSAYHLQALWLIFPSCMPFSNDFTFPCSSLTLLSTVFTYFSSLSNFSSTLPNASFSKIISNFGIMLPAMLKAFVISSVDWLPSESDLLPHFSFLSNGEKDSSSDDVEIIFFQVFLLELSAIKENSKTQLTKTLHVRHLARPSPLILSVFEKACIPRIY